MAEKNRETITMDNMITLIKAVSESKLDSFEYTDGEISVKLHADANTARVCATSTETGYTEEKRYVREVLSASEETGCAQGDSLSAEPEGSIVKSPLVGVFYSAPAAEAQPFVKTGDRVKKGQTLAIIEAMKMMNEIESDYDGIIAEILADNAQSVEYGQPLFRITT